MNLHRDFKEFIELLNAHEVQYLVIGGYAVNFHGYPRYTKDIDFWIWIEKNNINKLLHVIQDFGFGALGLTATDFSSPDNIIQLGQEPYRIDILMSIDGVGFEEAYSQKVVFKSENIKINFLDINHC